MKYSWLVLLMSSFVHTQAQRYFGGLGNGFVGVATESFVSGGNPNARYMGSTGDGFSSGICETYLSGGNPNTRYVGGTGDGFATQIADGFFISGGSPNARFLGGNGQGYHSFVLETFTSGGNPYARFRGGNGNGFHSNEGQLILALPVVLTQFDAVYVHQQVELTWVTAQEINNLKFDIERSSDKLEWTTIHTIAGKGTTNKVNSYVAKDESPLAGVSYYRLKQTDLDGSVDCSKIVAVYIRNEHEKMIEVTPNPNDGNFQITFNVLYEDAVLSDINGKKVRTFSNNGLDPITITGLQTGMYILSIITSDKQIKSTKICVY